MELGLDKELDDTEIMSKVALDEKGWEISFDDDDEDDGEEDYDERQGILRHLEGPGPGPGGVKDT